MELAAGSQAKHVEPGLVPPDAFRAMFDANVSYVAASLGRLGVNEADRDDLVCEVFVRVHAAFAGFDSARPVRPWLFAFAARVASEHRRLARNRHEIVRDGVDAPSGAPTPEQAAETDQSRRLVQRALDTLDPDQRAVVVLHDLDETPVPEIARVLGIPEGTAYSRLRAGRAALGVAIRRAQSASERRAS
jgi:RNA polymerase sigma-70 factor (ECF subfamily)